MHCLVLYIVDNLVSNGIRKIRLSGSLYNISKVFTAQVELDKPLEKLQCYLELIYLNYRITLVYFVYIERDRNLELFSCTELIDELRFYVIITAQVLNPDSVIDSTIFCTCLNSYEDEIPQHDESILFMFQVMTLYTWRDFTWLKESATDMFRVDDAPLLAH